MLRNIMTKTIWDQRRSLLAWAIGISAAAVMYAAFYPSIRNPEMEAAMESYPELMMQAFGFQDLISPEGYLGSTVFGIIGPILILIFMIGIGTRAIAGAEEAGTLDLLLAYPVSRTQMFLQRWGALVIAALIVGAAVLLLLLIIAGPSELEIPASRMLAMVLHLALLGVFFGTLALALGAILGRRALTLSITGLVAVGAYFANTLAPQVEAIAWLQDVSPFHYYSGGQPLRNGLQWGDAGMLLAVIAVMLGAGTWAFNRRDIAV